MLRTLFKIKKGKLPLLILSSVFTLFIFGCSPAGLNLIRQLEARGLKSKAIQERAMCFYDYVDEALIKSCYAREVAQLIAKECQEIRKTEPILQPDCEDFLYRIVMRPDATLPEVDAEDAFPDEYRNTDSFHPAGRGVECAEDSACRSKCREIFTGSAEQTKCYVHSVSAVGQMHDVFSKLKEPTVSGLNAIRSSTKLRYLKLIFYIDLAGVLSTFTTAWGDTTTDLDTYKIVWKWIAENQVVADTLSYEIDGVTDYSADVRIADSILEANSLTDFIDNLNTSLTSSTDGDNMIDIMLERSNEKGLIWIHYILKKTVNDSLSVFKEYCKIQFHDRNEERYFNYAFFTNILDDVLLSRFSSLPDPGPTWWLEYTVSQDLDSDQWWDSDTTNAESDVEDRSVCEFVY